PASDADGARGLSDGWPRRREQLRRGGPRGARRRRPHRRRPGRSGELAELVAGPVAGWSHRRTRSPWGARAVAAVGKTRVSFEDVARGRVTGAQPRPR